MSDTTNDVTGRPVSNEDLRMVAEAAKRLQQVESSIKHMEATLSDLKEQQAQLSQHTIPELMLDIGLEEFTLKDGTSVQVSKFYQGKIPEDKSTLAFNWLRDNGFGSLIKREVKLMFGKGEDKKADQIVKKLKKLDLCPLDKTAVHPQTLKAFIREQMEAGNELPTDLLGVYVGNQTKLTPSK